MKQGIDCVGIYVVAVCHDGNGNVLYAHRSQKARDEQNKWNIGAGGTLEVGESLEECMTREMKEEIGAGPIQYSYMVHRELFREHNGIKSHWIGHYFKVLVNPADVVIMEDECDGHLWQSFHEMPTPMMTHYEETYNKFKHHF